MTKKDFTILLLTAALAACSGEDHDTPHRDIRFALPIETWQSGKVSRVAAEDYNAEVPDIIQPTTIGVWGYGSLGWMENIDTPPQQMNNVSFSYESYGDRLYHKGSWNATTGKPADGAFQWKSGTYSFYAYAPYLPDALGVQQASFNKDKKTLSLNIPVVSPTDYVVAKAVKTHNPDNDGVVVKFTEPAYSFRHIYSCVRLAFALESKYAAVRYIDIKNVEVSMPTTVGGQYTYSVETGTASWNTTAEKTENLSISPETSWHLGDLPGMHTSNAYHTFGAFYLPEMPCSEAPLSIAVTYDVYDLAATRTRKDVVAKSIIKLGGKVITLKDGVPHLLPGYFYNILIYIVPDYLYVLSDNDNGADGVIVINE